MFAKFAITAAATVLAAAIALPASAQFVPSYSSTPQQGVLVPSVPVPTTYSSTSMNEPSRQTSGTMNQPPAPKPAPAPVPPKAPTLPSR